MSKDNRTPKKLLGLSVTPIPSDIDSTQITRALDKLINTVNKSAWHIEKIPDIQEKIEVTGSKIVELDIKMGSVWDRISKVESKVDDRHRCEKKSSIDDLKTRQRQTEEKIMAKLGEGAAHRAQIDSMSRMITDTEADVEEIKRAPRKMLYTLIALIATLLTGSGGAVWFLAELTKDVEFERVQRTEQFDRIEKRIKEVGKKYDTTPVRAAIKSLEEEIEASDNREKVYDDLCKGMTMNERKLLRLTLKRRDKRIPTSCFR